MNNRDDHPNAPGSPEPDFREMDIIEPTKAPSLVNAMVNPAERVFGAQNVAVKRRIAEIKMNIRELAQMAGEDWYYSWEVKNKRGGKDLVEGPSIKCANDLARVYGNCDVDTRVVDGPKVWVIYARFIDLETGFSMTRPFQQRKGQSSINTKDPGRSEDMAFQIGVSKAIRNVVRNALQTFADFALEEAKKSIVEKIGKDLAGWRARTVEGLKNARVDLKRVEKIVGRPIDQWVAKDVAKVISGMKAVADGMANWSDVFPPEENTQGAPLADEDDAPAENGEQEQSTGGAAGSTAQPKAEQSNAPGETAAKTAGGAGKAEKKQPSNREEYIAHVETWLAMMMSAAAVDQQWKAERDLRPSLGLTEEDLDDLKDKREKRKAELKGKV